MLVNATEKGFLYKEIKESYYKLIKVQGCNPITSQDENIMKDLQKKIKIADEFFRKVYYECNNKDIQRVCNRRILTLWHIHLRLHGMKVAKAIVPDTCIGAMKIFKNWEVFENQIAEKYW